MEPLTIESLAVALYETQWDAAKAMGCHLTGAVHGIDSYRKLDRNYWTAISERSRSVLREQARLLFERIMR